uniref:Uncharacterized protein n=1 Tax=Sipha flava TaxID=143950 RepID=A0A2S2QV91_9HEMI
MLSYNEFLSNNTAVELIDSGSIIKKQLCDLYKLPDYYKYDPLCISIKPINEISYPKLGKLCVQPSLLESELHKGYVLVNTKTIDTINELHSEMNWEDINVRKLLFLAITTKELCSIKETDFSKPGNFNNSIIQKINNSNNLTIYMEKQDLEYVTEFSNELIETCNAENIIQLKTLLNSVNVQRLKNIFTDLICSIPKYFFLVS